MKFDKQDKLEIAKRNEYFSKNAFDPKFVADNWPLFAGKVPTAIFLARYEIVKLTVDVPGHVLEFGCYHGTNLVYMTKILQLLSPHNLKKVFGFDSFEGLTQLSSQDKLPDSEIANYKGNRDMLEEVISVYDLDEIIQLKVGYIEETLPKFVEENGHLLISLVYIDTDLYASTKVILEECWPRLSVGGLVVFDEGYHDRFPGEGQAMQEFLQTISGQYEMRHIRFARQPILWLKKK